VLWRRTSVQCRPNAWSQEMTNASDCHADAERPSRGPAWPRSLPVKWMVTIAVLLGAGILAAGCGGSSTTGSGSTTSSGGQVAQGVAYTNCMRRHGVSNFPDPTLSSSGGVTFQGSFNQNSPTYQAAAKACQSLMPGGVQHATVSTQQLAAEVKWAQCIRSHGVPTFPDPNAQGEFDSSKFDPTSSAFQTASQACRSLQPTGAVGAAPGSGP
jgi:hypothetical protein